MLVYNATGSSWDEVQSVGNFYINTISSYSGTGGNSATFNNAAYRFVLSNAPTYAQQLIVSINGVLQKPNAGTSQPSEGFAIDGSSIIFSSAPPSGADYFIVTIGASVNIGAPSDNTVSNAAIIDGAIDNAAVNTNAAIAGSKLADDSIAEVKLDISNTASDGQFLQYKDSSDKLTWASVTGTPEGTAVKSTGESGTAKFLRVDGDGSCSWQVPSYTTNTDTNTQLTQEQVEDFVGGMLDGTETGITVTYDDNDGNIDIVVATQTPEGTTVLSTGESGGTKFLREDGDGSCSWQSVPAGYTHPNHSGDVTSSGDGATTIANNAVTLAKMAGLARGKIIYGDASGDPAALTVGSANQVLTSDGTDIAWAAGASGSSADGCIWKNTLTISNAHTIAATEGAHSVGPITLSATVTVNGRWVIS